MAVQGTAFAWARQPVPLELTSQCGAGTEKRVEVSDPTRTVVDLLDKPSIGGGIRNVADVLEEYFSGDDRDDELLIAYGDRLGNRTVFKRLGYLVETLDVGTSTVIDACLARRSAGLSKLDPSIRSDGSITKRWGLRINAHVGPATRS
jgi:predicted transcriptional regulator of viral defense system